MRGQYANVLHQNIDTMDTFDDVANVIDGSARLKIQNIINREFRACVFLFPIPK
jgi:hypothetical protein